MEYQCHNWATRQGVIVPPASNDSTHQESNLNSFDFVLTDKEMEDIKQLDRHPPRKRGLRSFDNKNDDRLIGNDTNEGDLHFINKVNSRVNVYLVQKGGSDHSKHILMGHGGDEWGWR
jgi:hypothetical protein